jgi:hypothetical protein
LLATATTKTLFNNPVYNPFPTYNLLQLLVAKLSNCLLGGVDFGQQGLAYFLWGHALVFELI